MTPPLAIISGAAGEIGQAIARSFLSSGHAVAVLDRTPELARGASATLGADGHVAAFAADQTDRDALKATLADVVAWGGAPHAVVANAGYAKYSPILSMDSAVWARHVDVNLTGTFHLCQLAAQHMVAARQPGSLTLVASSLAVAHSDQVGGYCVSKAALLPLTRTLAAELGIYRIRTNAVLPGVVETRMTTPMLEQPGVRDELLDHTPAGRLGSPEDIAAAVAFLASHTAAWITGADLRVDGGQSIYNQPQWLHQHRAVAYEPSWVPGLGHN
jgi:NAD(P)-dependent dehydrogenase (short-subunit alcohol dehydrogenase family)